MKMADLVPGEQLREVSGISRPRRRLDPAAVFLLVRRDQRGRPSIFLARFLLPQAQDWLGRRIKNRRLQSPGVRMPDAGQRRMDRADRERKAPPFEREHFRVAKRLRENRVTRVEVAETHFRISETGNRIPERRTSTLVRRSSGYLSEIRYSQSEIRKTARPCPGPSRNPVRANPPCSA